MRETEVTEIVDAEEAPAIEEPAPGKGSRRKRAAAPRAPSAAKAPREKKAAKPRAPRKKPVAVEA